VGLLTGGFKCAIPLWLVTKTRLRRADWDEAVAFGFGFGGIEAFLMGVVGVVMAALLVVFPDQIPASVRDSLWKLTSSTIKTAEFEAMISVFAWIAIWALPKLKAGFAGLEQPQEFTRFAQYLEATSGSQTHVGSADGWHGSQRRRNATVEDHDQFQGLGS
jgi:hypothetical protein